MKNLHFIHRLNAHPAPVRQATDTGHGAYDRPAPTRADDPRWQLPPCKPEGPAHDMAVLQAHLLAAQKALEALESAQEKVLSGIELDPGQLTPARKRRTVGKSGVPPMVTP